MAVDYTSLELILAAELKNARKIEAQIEHARRASSADHNRRLLSATNAVDFNDTEEARLYGDQVKFFEEELAPALEGAFSAYRSQIEKDSDLFGILKVDIPMTADDIAANPKAIQYVYDDIEGQISIIERRGALGALRRDMLANSKHVKANVISFGTFTAQNGNRGSLSVGSMSGESHGLTGVLSFEVVDESVDAPKIRIVNTLTNRLPDGTKEIEADNYLTPEKSFQDGQTGITATINRDKLAAPDETGDDGNMFSSTSISTPAESDMNGGVLYVVVTRQASAPIWLIEFYNSSAKTACVGRETADGTSGSDSLDVTLSGESRFQSTFDKAAAHAHLPSQGNSDSDISFDIKTPRLGDRWTRTITNDEAGNFATKIAKLWRVSLPTDASPSFTDANAASIAVS